MTASEKIEDFKEVTEAEKSALEASDAKWERPPQSFIDEWNNRCILAYAPHMIKHNTYGQYNEDTGFFELNGLTDISYKEAIEIMKLPNIDVGYSGNNKSLCHSLARTTIPLHVAYTDWEGLLVDMTKLEVVRFVDGYITSGQDPETTPISVIKTGFLFTKCYNLREVKPILSLSASDWMEQHFYGTGLPPNIEKIWLKNIRFNIEAKQCRKIIPECVTYMVENAANTTDITITLHPDAYARVTDELFALAAEKNITIATT